MTKYDDKVDLKHLDELNKLFEKQVIAGDRRAAMATANRYFELMKTINKRREGK